LLNNPTFLTKSILLFQLHLYFFLTTICSLLNVTLSTWRRAYEWPKNPWKKNCRLDFLHSTLISCVTYLVMLHTCIQVVQEFYSALKTHWVPYCNTAFLYTSRYVRLIFCDAGWILWKCFGVRFWKLTFVGECMGRAQSHLTHSLTQTYPILWFPKYLNRRKAPFPFTLFCVSSSSRTTTHYYKINRGLVASSQQCFFFSV
jgi:hypothetical protein